MKFKMIVKNAHSEWEETYIKDTENARQCAQDIIDYWNNTLRPHDLPRELIGVEMIDESNATIHKWVKLTAGMSVERKIRGKKEVADLYRCEKCMITGYRLGLHPTIFRDHKYRAKKYGICIASARRAK